MTLKVISCFIFFLLLIVVFPLMLLMSVISFTARYWSTAMDDLLGVWIES